MVKEDIIKTIRDKDIEFIELQFTDIFGLIKSTIITPGEVEKAFACELMFDGSSIDGYSRIEESDMYLMPDQDTFVIKPWKEKEAFLICDVYQDKDKPYPGCPRTILKQVLERIRNKGYEVMIGTEGEFFLFNTDEKNEPIFDVHDNAGYFDISPIDKGAAIRKDIVRNLQKMGFTVEAAHHEVASSQHEIDFQYGNALLTADRFMIFKYVVKNIARQFGIYATFMPKPITGKNGSAMHCHQSVYIRGENVFFDSEKEDHLSDMAKRYIAGILKHAPGMTAIANPTINSYKRLKAGYEAPVNIVWSNSNRSALIRVPKARGNGTRMEFRSPDPTCNPYLLFALMISSGIRGIENEYTIEAPVDQNIFGMNYSGTANGKKRLLPKNLNDALKALEHDSFLKGILGDYVYNKFLEYKYDEWEAYEQEVFEWEIDQYFYKY